MTIGHKVESRTFMLVSRKFSTMGHFTFNVLKLEDLKSLIVPS